MAVIVARILRVRTATRVCVVVGVLVGMRMLVAVVIVSVIVKGLIVVALRERLLAEARSLP